MQAEQHHIKSRACMCALLQLLGRGSSSKFKDGEGISQTGGYKVSQEWHTNKIIY
jgi:hypothetical protein